MRKWRACESGGAAPPGPGAVRAGAAPPGPPGRRRRGGAAWAERHRLGGAAPPRRGGAAWPPGRRRSGAGAVHRLGRPGGAPGLGRSAPGGAAPAGRRRPATFARAPLTHKRFLLPFPEGGTCVDVGSVSTKIGAHVNLDHLWPVPADQLTSPLEYPTDRGPMHTVNPDDKPHPRNERDDEWRRARIAGVQ